MSYSRSKNNNKYLSLILTLVVMSDVTQMTSVYAQEVKQQANSISPVPAYWKCKWCEFDEVYGESWQVEIGVANLSQESIYFMRYRGIQDDGISAIVNFRGESLDEDGFFWQVEGNNLGLNNRSLSFLSGIQGDYEFSAIYREISQYNGEVASPFAQDADHRLALPDSWVFADSTDGLIGLDDKLQIFSLGSKRKSFDLSGLWQAKDNLPQFKLDYKKENKKGIRSVGAAIGIDNAFEVNSSLLPLAFEYDTQQIDAKISYVMQEWQFQAGFYSSIFSDKNSMTGWQNAFSNDADGWGAFAPAPDNQFQQVYFSADYRFLPGSQLDGYLAIGQMKQNENFVPYTVNASLASSALPVDSLDGKVNTLTSRLKLVSRINNSWRLNASYRFDEKDNKTKINLFNYIVNDSIVSLTARQNIPYSYARSTGKVNLEYRTEDNSKLTFGLDYELYDRTYQQRKETQENTFWLDYKTNLGETFDARLKLERSVRDGDAERIIEGLLSNENPLMSKFYLADRQRDHLQLDMAFYPSDRFNLSFMLDIGQDDYQKSSLGLLESDYQNYSLDLTWLSSESLTFYSYISYEYYASLQAGSQLYASADWFNDVSDKTYTIGSGFEYSIWEGELQVGVDLVYSESNEVNSLASDVLQLSLQSLPKVEVDLASIEFFLNYQINESTSLNTRFIYQSYEDNLIEDYALSADSLADVLLFNRQDQDQDISYLSLSISCQF